MSQTSHIQLEVYRAGRPGSVTNTAHRSLLGCPLSTSTHTLQRPLFAHGHVLQGIAWPLILHMPSFATSV